MYITLYEEQFPPANFTVVSSLVQQSLSDNILQHLQFRAPHGSVGPLCLPRARFFSLTIRFLMLGPVLLTN